MSERRRKDDNPPTQPMIYQWPQVILDDKTKNLLIRAQSPGRFPQVPREPCPLQGSDQMTTTYRITYMVDPGDGIESTTEYVSQTDDMAAALTDWWNDGPPYFVTKCEIINHDLMVK